MRPGTLCQAVFDGRLSPSNGHFRNQFDAAIFWNVAGRLHCNSTFVPRDGETVTVKVTTSPCLRLAIVIFLIVVDFFTIELEY